MFDSRTSRSSAGNVRNIGKCRTGFYVLQWVNCTPPLSSSNHYAILDVDSVEENSTPLSDLTDEATIAPDIQSMPTTTSHPVYPPHLKRWEQRLPRRYVVTSTPSENSLHLKVEVVTMDIQQLIFGVPICHKMHPKLPF